MSHEYVLWIATITYGIHALEEYELNWRDWAQRILKLPVDWGTFYIVNFLVIVLGVCAAAVGWRRPEFALSLPALMLINATFFHVLPCVVTRIFSPGTITAVTLFYPIAGYAYYGAHLDGILKTRVLVLSILIGAALMATPIVLLRIKSLQFFRQDRGDAENLNKK